MNPRFTDFWALSGRQYVPAAATDIRETFLRVEQERQSEIAAQWFDIRPEPYTTEATEPYVKVAK